MKKRVLKLGFSALLAAAMLVGLVSVSSAQIADVNGKNCPSQLCTTTLGWTWVSSCTIDIGGGLVMSCRIYERHVGGVREHCRLPLCTVAGP